MNPVYEADRRAYLLIHSRMRAPWVDPAMIWATKAGTKGVVWLGLAAGLFIGSHSHGRWAAILAVAALLAAEGVINVVLKPLVRRDRPFAKPGLASLLVAAPGPHSWPSAHAGSAVAAGVVLALSYPLWSWAFLLLAALIAYSRVYVGVHYPLDVAAGMLIGVVLGVAAYLLGGLLRPILPL